MEPSKEKLVAARHRMVQQQLRARDIADERVLEAFEEIPRELFLPEERRHLAYEDQPVPIGLGQTISQPYVVALMLQALDPPADGRVLDVGAGSGYAAAVLSRLCRRVYAIERLEQLTERAICSLAAAGVDNVTVVTGDGSLGLPQEAPYDGIICGAAAPDVPSSWVRQLADGGRIVAPTGGEHAQNLAILTREGEAVRRREIRGVRFVKLIGQEGWGK